MTRISIIIAVYRAVIAGAILAGVIPPSAALAQFAGRMLHLGAGGAGGGGGGTSFSLAYTDIKSNDGSSGLNTVTYNAGGDPSVGAADPNRVVVVVPFARINSTTANTSATICGISATHVSGAFVSEGGILQMDAWYASVPTGTTCAVTVVWADPVVAGNGIVVYRLVTSTPTPAAVQTAHAASAAGANLSLPSYTVPSGGGSLNIYFNRTSLGTPEVSWTNATSDLNTLFAPDGNNRDVSGAHVTAGGAVVVTASDPVAVSGSNSEAVMIGVAWGP